MRVGFFIAWVCIATAIESAVAAKSQPVVSTEHVVINTQEQAASWGLTTNEWSHYQDIMDDRRGVWSPGLDPITALGVEADTTTERNHYAALYVRSEFERTRKELSFQLAVDRAWARLYPDTPQLQARAIPSVTHEPITRYALIVSAECATCASTLAKRLTSMLEDAPEGVDVHVVGMADDDRALKDWLAQQPQIRAALQAGKATVNHGHDFADLTVLPAIYAKRASGQWSREL